MAGEAFIRDYGLLASEDFNFSLPETFEDISNLLRTLTEYRDYAEPSSVAWGEYIEDFFRILGFEVEKVEQRLLLLQILGCEDTSKAIVGLTYPDDEGGLLTPWLSWFSLVRFAASYYHVDWGILTNGFELKIFNFKFPSCEESYFWANLDRIVDDHRLDSFFTVYKVFSKIKGIGFPSTKPKKTRIEQRVNTLKSDRLLDIPKGLSCILEVYSEVAGGLDYSEACKRIAQNKGLLSYHTVEDACTRRIKLTTADFRRLLENKQRFIDYITPLYPDFSEVIKKRTDRFLI